jgi:hypothetical protein
VNLLLTLRDLRQVALGHASDAMSP